MRIEIESLHFFLGVNFEFIYWLENNSTKYLLIFDNSCAEIFNSNVPFDTAAAVKHRKLSAFYTEHKLFHQKKLGSKDELQNAHIFLLTPPREKMQVSTHSTRLVLGSELSEWFWEARSVSYGHLLIDWSPRSDDGLRCCTNSESVPSKLFFSRCCWTFKVLGRWTHEIFLLSICSNRFPSIG